MFFFRSKYVPGSTVVIGDHNVPGLFEDLSRYPDSYNYTLKCGRPVHSLPFINRLGYTALTKAASFVLWWA